MISYCFASETMGLDYDKIPSVKLVFQSRLTELLDGIGNEITDFETEKTSYSGLHSTILVESFIRIFKLNPYKYIRLNLLNEAKKYRSCDMYIKDDKGKYFLVLTKCNLDTNVYDASTAESNTYRTDNVLGIFKPKKYFQQRSFSYIEPSANDLSTKYADIMLHSNLYQFKKGYKDDYTPLYKKISEKGIEESIHKLLVLIDKDLNYSVYSASNAVNHITSEEFHKEFRILEQKQGCECTIF